MFALFMSFIGTTNQHFGQKYYLLLRLFLRGDKELLIISPLGYTTTCWLRLLLPDWPEDPT
jgi:hypothetical protein